MIRKLWCRQQLRQCQQFLSAQKFLRLWHGTRLRRTLTKQNQKDPQKLDAITTADSL
jgi:hypothetical protein